MQSCFANHSWRSPSRRWSPARRSAAVSADEAKQLGTTLTRGRRRKSRQQGRHDSRVHRRHQAAGGLPGRQHHAAGPVRRARSRASSITARTWRRRPTSSPKARRSCSSATRRCALTSIRRIARSPLPQRILDNTAKNATGAKTAEGGVALDNVAGRLSVPDPEDGLRGDLESPAALQRPGLRRLRATSNWNVDSAGVADARRDAPTPSGRGRSTTRRKRARSSATEPYLATASCSTSGPPAATAKRCCIVDAVNPLKQPRRAWQYLPGQRRVKLAPDLAYDTPNPGAAGAGTYDDVSVFNGAIDRFDWKLIGKKEMYVPYSSYRLTYHKNAADITKPNHLNPDLVRWELHRVWVVEATLKPGKRHIYSKRVVLSRRGQLDGGRLRPVRRARPALPVELRVRVVQLRRAGAVRRHVRDLRLQLGRLQHHAACSVRTTASST